MPSSAAWGSTASERTAPAGRFGWRQLVIACIAFALVGAAIPFAAQSAERGAAAARAESLRSLAGQYLDAIASGDADAATALVPAPGAAQIAPASVLQAAARIESPEVGLVETDGDAGLVQVRYRIRTVEVSALLEATFADGQWSITTSLAELPSVFDYAGVSTPSVAGVRIGGLEPLLLYPGAYSLDVAISPVYEYGGDAFVIDGNPGTVTEVGTSVRISQALLDEASRRALAHAELCQGSVACNWPSSVTIATDGQPYSRSAGVANAITVQVTIAAESGEFNDHVGVQVLLQVDDDGTVLEASCSGLPGFSEQPMPCEV